MADAAAVLRSLATVRERCRRIAEAAAAGDSAHFTLDRGRLPEIADRVADLTRRRYPDGRVPLHSRWRQFDAGGVDRKALLDARLAGRTAVGMARARVDLALVSVLLDAGAGAAWRYTEHATGQTFARSEGLAVATFRGFMAGRFSSDAGDPCRVDARALLRIDATALGEVFQAGPDNPLRGLDARAALLRRLGVALRERPDLFTSDGLPGHLFDALTHHRHAPHLPHANLHHLPPATFRHQLGAPHIVERLLEALAGIWPEGSTLPDGTPLGDVWRHPNAGGEGGSAGWVPLHKLTQWLALSLIEPFEWAGVHVNQLDELTALAEYRNGGLLLDGGVVLPRDDRFAARAWHPGDEWVVEWRALTVALIDELLPPVRERLGAPELTLPQLLEGGTWAAGREIAAEARDGGVPPVTVDGGGTLF